MTTVLVIEDEPNVRKLVAVNLISRGYTVLEAANVPQALGLLRAATPDLMILDIKLPEMTGWDLLAQIAADRNMTVEAGGAVTLLGAEALTGEAERLFGGR